ncbi:MAG TPA: hypothetical protein VHK68_04535 [Gemmatimonadales bacterium]|jgi:hypothetical protein|nr:hypothetical protein [Gemmatimonadales bacterium]
MHEVTLDFRGKRITATLNRGETESGTQLPRTEPPMWYVTIAGTALTKIPAEPNDSEATVRDRVLTWLQEHQDLLDRDQIVLGGG